MLTNIIFAILLFFFLVFLEGLLTAYGRVSGIKMLQKEIYRDIRYYPYPAEKILSLLSGASTGNLTFKESTKTGKLFFHASTIDGLNFAMVFRARLSKFGEITVEPYGDETEVVISMKLWAYVPVLIVVTLLMMINSAFSVQLPYELVELTSGVGAVAWTIVKFAIMVAVVSAVYRALVEFSRKDVKDWVNEIDELIGSLPEGEEVDSEMTEEQSG